MIKSLHVNISWNTTDLKTVLPILLTIVFFVIYWFTANSGKVKSFFYKQQDADKASVQHIFFTKYIGFLTMGIFPLMICLVYIEGSSPAYFGLTFIPKTSLFSLFWTIILCILVVPIAYSSAKKPKNWVNYPQIRAKVWTKSTVFKSALGWFLYLFGYELLFRGILLFPLVESIGVWPAIAINIALYSATHIPKGLDETIGAVPLGLVLCLLTLYSGTIWIAFFVHVAMAWTNCFTAFKFHPDMSYIKRKKQ